MDDIWFKEELVPAEATVEQIIKSIIRDNQTSVSEADQKVRSNARGFLSVDKPRWGELDPASHELLRSGQEARFYLVRLGLQFNVPSEAYGKRTSFIFARCSAFLWPAQSGQPQPTVYDVIPRDLYGGDPHPVTVTIGPELKLGEIFGVELATISTDFTIGTIEPVVIGWPGKNERGPYWDLRPNSQTLLGWRHLWLVIEVPHGCSGMRLAVRVEGNLQTHFGPIPIGPRSRQWDSRPSILIK